MKAPSRFLSGVQASSLWVKVWLTVLMAANLVVPVIHFDHLEAQIVLVAFFAGFALLVVLTGSFGFTRILGLGHILWFPLILFLIGHLDLYPSSEPYGLWMRAVIVLNSISLIIDVTDVVRYARGDRAEVVSFD